MRALLLSGGVDSMALAHWIRPDVAVTVDYGQLPAAAEIEVAAAICSRLGIRHEIVRIDCRALGVGHLAGQAETGRLAPTPEWWPYRNQLLVTLAGMRLVNEGLSEVMLGTVASDSAHADGRPEFLAAMDALMAVQEGQIRVTAPAAVMTAVDLVLRSGVPDDMLGRSFSCHASEYPCGQCRGCAKREDVLAEVAARREPHKHGEDR